MEALTEIQNPFEFFSNHFSTICKPQILAIGNCEKKLDWPKG